MTASNQIPAEIPDTGLPQPETNWLIFNTSKKQ
jgi:hypothetical protein